MFVFAAAFGSWRRACSLLDARSREEQLRTALQVAREQSPQGVQADSRPPLAAPRSPTWQPPGSPPKAGADEALGSAADRPSPGRRPSSLKCQLEEELAKRTRRSVAANGGDAAGGEAKPPICPFCGDLVIGPNKMSCEVCGKTYHNNLKCLTKSQASRFKGRTWRCDQCLDVDAS